MIDFYLYRTKFFLPTQANLFNDNDLKREEILQRILKEKPSIELREGHNWHIGNVHRIDDAGGYFAVGRTTKSILEKYDKQSGNFVEEQLETSPYTHVIFDRSIGFVAIAKKTKLSLTAAGIASKLSKLFNASDFIIRNQIDVSLDPISDPYDFIDAVKTAYSIRSFEVTFTKSNPFDADEFFQKPMEKYLDAARGEKGKTAISGTDLDSETLIRMTQSVAATGNDAKASLKVSQNVRYSTKRLRGNPAYFPIAEEEFSHETALDEARHTYAKVRDQK